MSAHGLLRLVQASWVAGGQQVVMGSRITDVRMDGGGMRAKICSMAEMESTRATGGLKHDIESKWRERPGMQFGSF